MSSVNKLAKNEFEILTEDHQFYIRKESNKFVVDIFDSKIKNNDNAHQDSVIYPTAKAAKIFLIEDYEVSQDLIDKLIFE